MESKVETETQKQNNTKRGIKNESITRRRNWEGSTKNDKCNCEIPKGSRNKYELDKKQV